MAKSLSALGVTLPVGIPIGQSGLAIFGAEGLVGLNVFPAFVEGPDRSWYYDWYKAPPVTGVTHSSKWTDRYLGFALGAGVTLCTADGFTVSTRALLVLALPGPFVLVEGRAAFLAPPTSLGENPPLRALMVLDLREATRSIQLFIEAQYEFVPDVLFAHGVLEVFAEPIMFHRCYVALTGSVTASSVGSSPPSSRRAISRQRSRASPGMP